MRDKHQPQHPAEPGFPGGEPTAAPQALPARVAPPVPDVPKPQSPPAVAQAAKATPPPFREVDKPKEDELVLGEKSKPVPEPITKVTLPPPPRPVPVAFWRLRIPLVAATSQSRVQLLPDQLFNEPAHPIPDARLDRVKPGVPSKQRRAVRLRLRAILFHGVVSAGAETPEMVR